jgi:hypothetical protein
MGSLVQHRPGVLRTTVPTTRSAALVVAVLAAIAMTACSTARQVQGTAVHLTARTRPLPPAAAVLTGTPEAVAAAAARRLFAAAPVVVVGSAAAGPAGLAADAAQAARAHAPLLLTQAGAGAGALRAEVRALRPRAVLAAGLATRKLAAQLPGVHVVGSPAQLPSTTAPSPLRKAALLVRRGSQTAATLAAEATARVAGARVIPVRGGDPRDDPQAIDALAAARPQLVLAVGARFGPAPRLAARVAVAATGVRLPGGGQVLFPRHRLVALYGHPGTAGLGALGQQDLAASIARVRRVAAQYRPLSRARIVPTFEIIATVAQGSPGHDGTYSYKTPVAQLRPWVRRATAAGMYVVLDLQPGRASFLTQAKRYQALLERPNVGLALDPEWKLGPHQLPLHQIGSVSIREVNSVVRWLAGLTARFHLPQKLLVLHQFRISMLQNERRLDTRHDDLSIVIHMDGQGTPASKESTWAAVLAAAPRGVRFGWKDFYVKDHPMMGPRQTIDRHPRPVMISYQ